MTYDPAKARYPRPPVRYKRITFVVEHKNGATAGEIRVAAEKLAAQLGADVFPKYNSARRGVAKYDAMRGLAEWEEI